MTVKALPPEPLAGIGFQAAWSDYGTNAPAAYYDVSLGTPDQQFAALVGLLEHADSVSPAPYTGTPPWTEGTPPDETIPGSVIDEEYVIVPDVEAAATVDILALTRDPFPSDFPSPEWYNDDQYYGLGVPPGVPNWDQPIESGHTQIIRQNPAAEQGWDAWSGRPQLARVARMFSSNPFYSAGTNRGHGVVPEKLIMPYALNTQQYRDLLLAEINKRGVHNVVVADVPSVPYTEQVLVTDPTLLTPEHPIGPEGVMPW